MENFGYKGSESPQSHQIHKNVDRKSNFKLTKKISMHYAKSIQVPSPDDFDLGFRFFFAAPSAPMFPPQRGRYLASRFQAILCKTHPVRMCPRHLGYRVAKGSVDTVCRPVGGERMSTTLWPLLFTMLAALQAAYPARPVQVRRCPCRTGPCTLRI